MSNKIYNPTLVGKKVAVSAEIVQFNDLGFGEIQSDKIFQEVIKLKNFFPIEALEEKEKNLKEDKNTPSKETTEIDVEEDTKKEEPKEVEEEPEEKKKTTRKAIK